MGPVSISKRGLDEVGVVVPKEVESKGNGQFTLVCDNIQGVKRGEGCESREWVPRH